LSDWAGKYMNKKRSKKKIKQFIDQHEMDLSDYIIPKEGFETFNEFFYRKIKPGARAIQEGVVSPADGKVLAFNKVDATALFHIKGIEFDLKRFLDNDNKLFKQYEGGAMVVVRLAPTDYHRFHFPVKGQVSKTKRVKGWLYSVSPLALKNSFEIFCHNKREYNSIDTETNGQVLHFDVGATMVGTIIQTFKEESIVDKGSEKGYFAFGGSTVVLLFEKGKVKLSNDLLDNTSNGVETAVKMGETIGV
jgi:phosphatidylserine decarboxylase